MVIHEGFNIRRKGGKGNCAVVGCTNSTYRLNKWRKEMCLEHQVVNDKCPCKRPYFSSRADCEIVRNEPFGCNL